MYYVLREHSAAHPYTAATKATWETGLCEAIAAYMGELVALANPSRGVYVSCDGVVCAAKRKQQRLRRFKGPWTRQMERSLALPPVGEEESESWDQNALTPGSRFMGELGRVLVASGARLQGRSGLQVTVSTTSEPGEGEHKLLRFMREVRPTSCTIYGLDADLILLSMLLWADTGAQVRLLREAQEFETRRPKATSHSISSGAREDETRKPRLPRYANSSSAGEVEKKNNNNDEWRNLDIVGLKDAMGLTHVQGRVRDFVATMSLLGNDFLPKPLTKSVRDDGIPALLQTLERSVWSKGLRIVNDDGAVSREGLLALVSVWAATEESDMLGAANEARQAMYRGTGGMTPLQEWNAQPATWGSLTQLLRPSGRELVPAWRDVYRRTWMAGSAADYCAGLAWTWDYYSGRTVELGWHFESHLPPLWSDVAAHLAASAEPVVYAPPLVHTTALPEWLHLLSVLPADSVRSLLPVTAHKHLESASHFWPSSWSLFDVGRTQMWECEPVIPVIPETVLRSWTRE